MDILVVAATEFEVPVDEFAVHVDPLVVVEAVVEFEANHAELLLVVEGLFLGDKTAGLGVLLDGEEDLVGVDGFDEVVAYLASEGLVHDVLLLTLGNHDDRELRVGGLDARERLEAADAGHVLVEEDDVDLTVAEFVEGLGAAGHGDDLVAAFFEEKDMGLEEFNLVVGPEYGDVVHIGECENV